MLHQLLSDTGEILAVLGVVIAAMLALAMPAAADETYVCEEGRIVTVRFGELAELARTDPCIARYLSQRSGALAPQPKTPVLPIKLDVPLPERKPAIAIAPIGPGVAPRHAATEIIVHHEAPPPVEAEGLRPRVEQIAFRRAGHHFYSNEELPKGPADFRNVPIINATPGETGIFHHTR